MDRETARDLLPAYALGALEDAERRELQELLADWPEGRAELAGLIATVDALPYALEEERPSLGLEGRIITRARAEREPWRRPRAAAPPRRVLRWLPHLMAASFAAAAAVLGVFAFTGGDEVIAGRWFDLPTTDNAAAYITYFDERPIGVLFRGLEPPPEERVYQLWRPAGRRQPRHRRYLRAPARRLGRRGDRPGRRRGRWSASFDHRAAR